MKCPFCGPAINRQAFYTGKHFVALYDIRPVVKGHSLVVTKRHVSSFLDLNAEEKAEFVSFTKKAIYIALKFSSAHQFDLILQEGKDAGQSIRHLHLHIIPRKRKDSLSLSKASWLRKFQEKEHANRQLDEKELRKIIQKLKTIAENNSKEIEKL